MQGTTAAGAPVDEAGDAGLVAAELLVLGGDELELELPTLVWGAGDVDELWDVLGAGPPAPLSVPPLLDNAKTVIVSNRTAPSAPATTRRRRQ
jgi:hypothetical protein